MARWVIVGASRGIGLGLARQVCARGDEVVATCRTRTAALDALGCTIVPEIDLADDRVGAQLTAALGHGPVDVLVCNAGILVSGSRAGDVVEDARRQLEVNALGPLKVVEAVAPLLREGSRVAFVSSRAGSIGDGPSGGMVGYRMSKAALNMLGANLARELQPRGVHVVVLHPGFVRTDMTGGAGTVDVEDAAAGLLARIDELDASRSGRFFHADGSEVAW